IRGGDGRLQWLDNVRGLDLALRGPRPGPGLDGLTGKLQKDDEDTSVKRSNVMVFWNEVCAMLAPLDQAVSDDALNLSKVIAAARQTVSDLCGEQAWSGAAGRAAADLIETIETQAPIGPGDVSRDALVQLIGDMLHAVNVRPAASLHPRISIWGLLEAKLQTADLIILGGLNEGVWPRQISPDPWLAPRIRRAFGLPDPESRIGVAAHDLVGAMGAKDVLLTRAQRDARAATIPSRFWLRLEALTGGLPDCAADYERWAKMIDIPQQMYCAAPRPAPVVPAPYRPKAIRVTEVDMLRSDPYAFYASKILKLDPLEPLDAEPDAAWRGTLVHAALENWAKEDHYRTEALVPQFVRVIGAAHLHPLVTRLWQPRFFEAAEWIAARVATDKAAGRVPVAAEVKGQIDVSGITLRGRLDRVDRNADGSLTVIDYKTGAPPESGQVQAGLTSQLGLIGYMIGQGGFEGVEGAPVELEYWSLARDQKTGNYGYVTSILKKDEAATAVMKRAQDGLVDAINTWLIGDAPFSAKLHPEYAFSRYDALMRYDEWAGR
ncbi:MAG: PD-(D/E)XK nuclease family protein, partial [Alphaproteobacteria bacterium]|nr:PD-(D/E)XK nuclease family protein [Alphaproteobacteria bacterium]